MKRLILVSLCVLFASIVALGDWDPGDPYKMHHPQLPDPTGWDVQFGWVELADDWLCTETGPVSDIHFWYSWENDYDTEIQGVNVKIYSDNPEGAGGYSEPAQLLWARQFQVFTSQWYGDGVQGWYDPDPDGGWEYPDHCNYYQINIVDIVDPFIQEQGTIYWLSLQLNASSAIGWKTSQDHWNDDAVYWNSATDGWVELRDPSTQESLDMAFVITPEPATMALLGLGSLVLFRKRGE